MTQKERVGIRTEFSWRHLIPRAIASVSMSLIFSVLGILVIGLILGIAGIITGLLTWIVAVCLMIIIAIIVLVIGLIVGLIGLTVVLMLVPLVGLAFAGLYLFAIHPALIAIPIVVFLLIYGGVYSVGFKKLFERYNNTQK